LGAVKCSVTVLRTEIEHANGDPTCWRTAAANASGQKKTANGKRERRAPRTNACSPSAGSSTAWCPPSPSSGRPAIDQTALPVARRPTHRRATHGDGPPSLRTLGWSNLLSHSERRPRPLSTAFLWLSWLACPILLPSLTRVIRTPKRPKPCPGCVALGLRIEEKSR
jgi:hypothetical protein